MFEQHALVKHGEFEVGVGIVDRMMTRLGDDDDREGRRGEEVGGAEQADALLDAEGADDQCNDDDREQERPG